MKRVGILTLYYNSLNCGGNLQAFALPYLLEKNGIKAEQISYDYLKTTKTFFEQNHILGARNKKTSPILLIKKIWLKIYKQLNKETIVAIIQKRKKTFKEFQASIPHTETVYTDENIDDLKSFYAGLLVGSDQVWNLNFYHRPFFLDFESGGSVVKASYAASISMKVLSENESSYFAEKLDDFSLISVREKQSKKLLTTASSKIIHVVLDPTLLITKAEWEQILFERNIDSKTEKDFIFCYFMGDDNSGRKAAKRFARAKKLEIVNIPLANGHLVLGDLEFGVDSVNDFSPLMFVDYIRKAKYIFTDSFHATVFSILFNKPFFVFDRAIDDQMNCRIEELCEMFNVTNRYCSLKKRQKLSYLCSQNEKIEWKPNPIFDERFEQSVEFIKKFGELLSK